MAKKSEIFAQAGFLGTCMVVGAAALPALPGSLFGLVFLAGGIVVAGGAGAAAGALIGGAIDTAQDMIKAGKEPGGSPAKVLKDALLAPFKTGKSGNFPEATAAETGAMTGAGLGIVAGYGLAIAGFAVWGAALVPALSAAALVVVGCTAGGAACGWGVGKSIDLVRKIPFFAKKCRNHDAPDEVGIDESLPRPGENSRGYEFPALSNVPGKGALKNTFGTLAQSPPEVVVQLPLDMGDNELPPAGRAPPATLL